MQVKIGLKSNLILYAEVRQVANMNRIRVTVWGAEYSLMSADPPEYVRGLAGELNRQLEALVNQQEHLSQITALVLCSINALDESNKAKADANALRVQNGEYLAAADGLRRAAGDARSAEEQAEERSAELARRLEEARAQLAEQERRLEEGQALRERLAEAEKRLEGYSALSDELADARARLTRLDRLETQLAAVKSELEDARVRLEDTQIRWSVLPTEGPAPRKAADTAGPETGTEVSGKETDGLDAACTQEARCAAEGGGVVRPLGAPSLGGVPTFDGGARSSGGSGTSAEAAGISGGRVSLEELRSLRLLAEEAFGRLRRAETELRARNSAACTAAGQTPRSGEPGAAAGLTEAAGETPEAFGQEPAARSFGDAGDAAFGGTEGLPGELTELRRAVEDAKAEAEQLRQERDDARRENEALRLHEAEVTGQEAALRVREQELTDRLRALRGQEPAEDVQDERLEALSADNARLRETVGSLQDQLRDYGEQLQAARDDADEARQASLAFEERAKTAEATVESQKAEIDWLYDECDRAQAEAARAGEAAAAANRKEK